MSSSTSPEVGSIGWVDLTVDDASGIRDFYAKVVGWEPAPVDMGDYADFSMEAPGSGEAKAGVCHARGTNAELPSCWMIYVIVANLDESASSARELGGQVLVAPKDMGPMGRYCVIQDPAGAVCALFEPAS